MKITLDDVRYVADAYLVPVGIKILLAAVIFVVGRWVSRAISFGSRLE